MTMTQFIEKLANTRVPWRLVDGQIRTGQHCPLSYVGKGNFCTIETPCGHLGLSLRDGHRIADAADNCLVDDDCVVDSVGERLRVRLLKACGLTERVRAKGVQEFR